MMKQEPTMREIRVFAPASIGNLSVGFDALGLALSPLDGALLGDVVSLRADDPDDWVLETSGAFASELPEDPEQNVVLASCRRYEQTVSERGGWVRPLQVHLDKSLPIGSGLGSSASSVVAILEALNRFHRYPLTTHELFELMAEMEGSISGDVHLDNIAPSLYGGLRLCPLASPATHALPWPAAWRVVICWPGTRLETRKARAVLPESVSRGIAIEQAANFASFVHALHAGDAALAARSVTDRIAEPHRRALLPGFEHAKTALADLGALAVGIAGSGPTIFAIIDDFEVGNAVEVWMENNYRANDRGFVHQCRADLGGARSID
jgi:homoserine kinase